MKHVHVLYAIITCMVQNDLPDMYVFADEKE